MQSLHVTADAAERESNEELQRRWCCHFVMDRRD
jgi:hypothetical protein